MHCAHNKKIQLTGICITSSCIAKMPDNNQYTCNAHMLTDIQFCVYWPLHNAIHQSNFAIDQPHTRAFVFLANGAIIDNLIIDYLATQIQFSRFTHPSMTMSQKCVIARNHGIQFSKFFQIHVKSLLGATQFYIELLLN